MAANQDQGVFAGFNFLELETGPQEGSLSQEDPSNAARQSADNAAPNPNHGRLSLNLNLNLTLGGQDASNLERSISLPASLAMNEKGPLPPKDFLSLAPSSSLPARLEPPQHQNQPPHQLQLVRYAGYHHKRPAGRTMREPRLLLPAPPQPQQPVLQIQHRHQVTVPQLGNQPVMAPPLNMVLPQTVHQIQQQAMIQAPPAPPTFEQQHLQHQLHKQVNLRDTLVPAPTNSTFSAYALDHLDSLPDRAIWRAVLATGEGSSNLTLPPHMDVHAPPMDANKGKQSLLPPPSVIIPPSWSNRTAPVEDPPESESVAKRMREMQEKGREDGRELMRQMPGVAVNVDGTVEENRTDGFLYKYLLGDVTIMCNCHGTFFCPGEFVEHGGGTEVDNPMKHITVNPDSL